MPISQSYVDDVDLDTEENESLLAAKIQSEIQQSRSYWQEFKDLCTELYFDFLAYKESIRDKTKSNTFIPLPYVDIMVTKAAIKKPIILSRPYGRVKPIPYDPMQSFKLSQFGHRLLDEANFRSFLDLMLQDALIYTGAPFQVTYGVQYKKLPAFQEIGLPNGQLLRIPAFDEKGKRIYRDQEIREGIFLENIPIQDFYLAKNSKEVESDVWAGKHYFRTLKQLEREVNPDGSPKYKNLNLFEVDDETKRADTSEIQRMGEPIQRDYPSSVTFGRPIDIIEICTDDRILHWPEGKDFIIRDEPNPYKKKPYHIARVEKLTNQPFGFSPNRANHLLTRTMNEMVDIIMDGLFLEDNKAWIINEDLVDDFELGATQGNIIHVTGVDPGVDVTTAVRAMETRALATETMVLWEKLDKSHQLVAARPDITAGIPTLGAETAYENAALLSGAAGRPMDMLENITTTALRPIYEDMLHLLQVYFAIEKSIELLDDNGQIVWQTVVNPSDVYGDYQFEFEFLNKERNKIEERAALTNLLMVWGNVKNVDEVSALLIKNLLLQSGISDTDAISKAIDVAIQKRQQMEMMALMAKTGGGQAGPGMPALPMTEQQSIHQPMVTAANAANAFKPTGM